MIKKFNNLLAILLFTFFLFPAFLFASDELYDAPGFDPHRETFTSMPNEHIDTFTGGLILTFEDIRLSGNGGLDLVIQRTYNSKNTCNGWAYNYVVGWTCAWEPENSWLGYGWTLHFGRLFKSRNVNTPHLIEMPDGSIHKAYHDLSRSKHITKEYWILDTNPMTPVLTLANGTKIYYGQNGLNSANLATKIQDVHGNEINIYYKHLGSDEILYVIDSVGRRIDFTTATINYVSRLISISGPGVSISYTHQSPPTILRTFLIEAKPPVGDPWKYTYNQSTFELTQLTTPSGGIINYTTDLIEVKMGFTFHYRGVTKKVTSGTAPAGTWTLAYSQGSYRDYTQITDPCGRTTKYTYYGYGSGLTNGSMWMIGLPKSKEIVGEETVTYEWSKSAYISTDNYSAAYIGWDNEVYVPLITKKSVTRDTKTYVTSYNNYDTYANPKTISETGDKTRNRNLTYWYNTSKNIVQNKPLSEIVSGDFTGTFTTNYSYDTNTGDLLQINKYGVVTYYSYYTNGNLLSKVDANGNVTNYQWTYGRVSRITNPIYYISRSINYNGTIASEINGRGFTTSFTYDGNLRLTKITPPFGYPTNFTYPADNSYKYETRGLYYIVHYNDGFGRPTGSLDIKGIDIDVVYKACGPKNYSTSNIGDTTYYDNFGRVTKITHKDNANIIYAYSSSNVTVTDEALNTTYLNYNAFGNPDEKLLVSVKDPLNNTTNYNYNILGSLTSITQGAITRTFAYDTKNFLTSETHPEKGTITYTRDNIGNLKTKTDVLGTTSYTYDAIYRLWTVNYGTGTVIFTYDNANNRVSMSSASANVTYVYDALNRLTQKGETIQGRVYNTYSGYDWNDNLITLDYPSGNRVTYAYNNKNQVTSVTGSGWGVTNMTYFTIGTPIGLPQSFTYSNALTTNLTYTTRNLTKDIDVSALVLDLAYAYDTRGNMTSMTNNLDPLKSQTFGYDKLNRLTSFNGPWGAGAYTYDVMGNRLTKVVAGVTTNYTYTNNRLASTTGGEPFSFNYNINGDATYMKDAGVEYGLMYDRLHNLVSFNYYNGAALAQFSYDGDGMRVTKTSSGNTIVYHYDKDGRVISETNSNGNLMREYIHANGKLVAKIEPTARYFYHTDPAGTPLAMTDAGGSVVWRADYKPFGEEQLVTGNKENDLRFVGKEKDKETELLYFGARYMEAMIGRFISPDPVGPVDPGKGKLDDRILMNPQRVNLYVYGLNNPYKYIDLEGKWAEDVHSGIGFKYGTYTWARQVGFSKEDAETIARSNNLTDTGHKGWLPILGDQSRHFNQPNPFQKMIDSRDLWAKIELERAVECWKKGDREAALGHLGKGLHSVQDKYAHGNWGTGLIGMNPHPESYDNWNDPRNKDAAKATERASKDYLRKFNELTR